MSIKLSLLLRKVFLSSMAGISANNLSHANGLEVSKEVIDEDSNIEFPFNKSNDLSPKLILKMKNKQLGFMAHRSHRSHSSHRSHYSSSSGGGGGGGSSYPSNSNSGIKSNFTSQPKTISAALRLGSRTLRLGMSGTDVTELINILLTKKYIVLEDGGTYVTGTYTYDLTIEDAVKRFQNDNNITVDGICAATTVYYLKNK